MLAARGQSLGFTMTSAMERMKGWGGLGKGEGPQDTSVVEQLQAPL